MSDDLARPRIAQIKATLATAIRFEIGSVDIEDTCRRFEAEGYEVTTWLRDFVANYSELSVVWRGTRGNENELSTKTDAALEVYSGNIRVYSRRLGYKVLPVGMAFETEERILLAENGDVLLAGDAGFQRVGKGFENSLRALLANEWDKAFFWS